MNTVSGKVAVITGGASGIGFLTAKALAAKCAKLVIASFEARARQSRCGTVILGREGAGYRLRRR
jgi:NAD(P)-dependent dehydrogenase (short-subunit alcohol dehydrogenase family)